MKYFVALLILLGSIGANSQDKKLTISRLTGDLYVYTTSQVFGGTLFPANGMYLLTDHGAVMIDTPWDTTQFQPLLDSIRVKHHKKVVMCIATHFHEDRTAGLEFFRKQGVKTFTTKLTDDLSKKNNKKRAEYLINGDTTFRVGQYSVQTFYPGQGHSPDNIVIWFDKNRVLYGGCFIKSTEASDIGNLSDANTKAWPASIQAIQEKFPKIRYVIPGHQGWQDKKSLEHTLELIKKSESKK
ncbi:beta-lactamase [Cytophagales bacterium WSM2-2]|nr:beta-lactamase [Cytophagales bacterium WSM2-2]